jgi:hypothetical protein
MRLAGAWGILIVVGLPRQWENLIVAQGEVWMSPITAAAAARSVLIPGKLYCGSRGPLERFVRRHA